MEKVASHNGVVTDTIANPDKRSGSVRVQIHVVSACSACEAHGKCGFADSKDKTMDIDTPNWQQFHVGDPVIVTVNANRGLQAVAIAYLLPSALLLTIFAILTTLHLSEGWVALATLFGIAIYACILYLCRHRLQRKFTMTINHKS